MSQATAENKVPPWERDWSVNPTAISQSKKPWERDWGRSEASTAPQPVICQDSVVTGHSWGETQRYVGVHLADGVKRMAGSVPTLTAPEVHAVGLFRESADYCCDREFSARITRICSGQRRKVDR